MSLIKSAARPIIIGLCILSITACATSPAQPAAPTGVPVALPSLIASATLIPAAINSLAPAVTKANTLVTSAPLAATQPAIANTGGSPSINPANTANPTAIVPLAALVNTSGRITMVALDAEVNRQLAARQSLNEPPPADMVAFRHTILDSLIQQMLIEQAAAIQNITVSNQDVDAEVQKYIQDAGSRDKWLAQVAADHMTETEYRTGLRSALLTLKMRDFVTRNIGTTADQVHARHILVADLVTAQQVAVQLNSGTNFVALAAKYSLDVTTKNSGGDLGWFTRGQLLQPAIENAAFTQPVNQISAPIQTDLGYDILQVVERQANRPLDPAVRARLSEQTFEIWLQTLIKAAQITKYV